jgi:glycosyltransferase involved in cell wall biosynthesis
MKILLIANAYPTRKRVCVAWLRDIAHGLRKCGIHVDRLVILGMARGRLARVWQYVVFYLRLLFVRLEGYDAIYLHQPSHTALPLLLRRPRRAKFVVNLHGTDLLPDTRMRLLGWVYRRVTLWACRRADLVVVPSDYFRRELRGAVEPKQVHVFPSGGIDTARFRPARQVEPGSLRVGCVGQLERGKAMDVLLRAAVRLGDGLEIVIIGDGPERGRLESLSRELRIEGRTRFLGAVPHDHVVARFQEFSVLVFPTRMRESLGLVALEAMACGVPVIGSRIGALPEYIREGENGYLFTPGDDAELAEVIARFARLSVDERKRMSRQARATALGYDANRACRELAEQFQRVVVGGMRKGSKAA